MTFQPALLALCFALPVLAEVPAEKEALMSASTTQGNQEIHDVATNGTGAQLKALLGKNPALLDVPNVRGATPLHLAAINPDPSAIEALLAAGANVNAKDEEKFTPLHMAAFHRQADYALLLLEAGADPTAQTNTGRTPLLMAEKARADETAGVISLWILKGCKPHEKCGLGSPRPVKKLLR